MRTAVGTYVDHIDVVLYPVAFLTNSWHIFDKLYWFASDHNNAVILTSIRESHALRDRIEIVVLNHKIIHPNDIGVAQEKAYEIMRAGVDYVVYQQADLYITQYGVSEIQKWLATSPADAVAVRVMQNQLFCETWYNPNGVMIIPTRFNYSSPGDGWLNYVRDQTTSDINIVLAERDITKRLALDLGYLSIDTYYRKMVNHNRIWPSAEKDIMIALLRTDKYRGVIAAITNLAGACDLVQVRRSGQYGELIDVFGLSDDYDLVTRAIAEVKGS